MKACKEQSVTPKWIAGVHFVALKRDDRILLPDLPCLHGLRHRWFWERRKRPVVPVWNFAKMPRPSLPAEENARLLSVYMRPWTLHQATATPSNPLLSDLACDIRPLAQQTEHDCQQPNESMQSMAQTFPGQKKKGKRKSARPSGMRQHGKTI